MDLIVASGQASHPAHTIPGIQLRRARLTTTGMRIRRADSMAEL
jgi:hypothetical protein